MEVGSGGGEMTYEYHTPVLLEETLQLLDPKPGGIYVDATLGGGGHAQAILSRLSEGGRVIGIDADGDAITFAKNRLQQFGARVRLVHDNFRNLKSILTRLRVQAIDGLLIDLGVSAFQLKNETKGFSFLGKGRLDMRMDRRQSLDAWNVVNHYPERSLADIFWKYGEERFSRRVAKKIMSVRRSQPINTTKDLADVVRAAVGSTFSTKSLARVFQAIRIEVNQELESLERVLRDGIELIGVGGRVVIISYHSLEDRIVKSFFRREAARVIPSRNKLLPEQPCTARLRILTRKPVVPSQEELRRNPHARSAKLRAAEKIP